MVPPGVVKVIPVSGTMSFPEIPVKVGTAWDFLFVNLMNWLPELDGIKDQNSVMLQYKTKNGWKPLAGDEQLKSLLNEFYESKWDLHIRCAPEDEFESSSERDERSGTTILRSHKEGLGGSVSMSANKENKKTVSHPNAQVSIWSISNMMAGTCLY